MLAPGSAGLGPWLPVHLLLAGAATTAIAGVMPFFSAAVANAPPAPPWLRLAAIVGVASGALLVAGGRIASPALAGGNAWIAGAGGVVFIGGLFCVGAATILPLRSALGARRFVMGSIYGIALVNVIIGATLASLLLLGWLPVLQNWAALKPAHAWLNVFGFVSLVISGSLLHLLPTVAGARITRTRASVVCFACVATGPLAAALGFAIGSTAVAAIGASILVVGAVALAVHGLNVITHRAKWTTDPGWHRFTTWSLMAGIGWFVVGTVIAAGMIVVGGATAAGWQLAPLIAPIGVGWIAQVLFGAWSHLVPAVGPGLPERHAAQRRFLGRGSTERLVILNLGVAAMVIGEASTESALFVAGILAIALAGAAGLVLLVAAFLAPGPRRVAGTLNQ